MGTIAGRGGMVTAAAVGPRTSAGTVAASLLFCKLVDVVVIVVDLETGVVAVVASFDVFAVDGFVDGRGV